MAKCLFCKKQLQPKPGYETRTKYCNVSCRNKEKYTLDPDKFKNRAKKYQRENLDKVKARKRKTLTGWTQEEYDQAFEDQEGLCAVCNKPSKDFKKGLVGDHNHTTKRKRALLCGKCNTAIGLLNDSPELAEKVADYLREYQEGKSWPIAKA